MTRLQSLTDSCERALELIQAIETDCVCPGLMFAESALRAVKDVTDVHDVRTLARHAERCLAEVSEPNNPEHRHQYREARQLVIGVRDLGGAC